MFTNTTRDTESEVWRSLAAKRMDTILTPGVMYISDKISFTALTHLSFNKPTVEDIVIPHWRILPIIGKAPEIDFWYRLANGIFNVNMRIRSTDQLAYLEERDYFHDVFGHTPILHDREFSYFIRSLGVLGELGRDNSKFLKGLSNFYWHTAEFGVVNESARKLIYGAGIMSSDDEHRFVSGLLTKKPEFRQLNVDVGLEDVYELEDYVTDGFQSWYLVLESWDDLKRILEFLWRQLVSGK